MIRFIDLRGQITNDNDPCFAFYDTVRDRFLVFRNAQTWDSVEDFIEDSQGLGLPDITSRCLPLIPTDYFTVTAKQSFEDWFKQSFADWLAREDSGNREQIQRAFNAGPAHADSEGDTE